MCLYVFCGKYFYSDLPVFKKSDFFFDIELYELFINVGY